MGRVWIGLDLVKKYLTALIVPLAPSKIFQRLPEAWSGCFGGLFDRIRRLIIHHLSARLWGGGVVSLQRVDSLHFLL